MELRKKQQNNWRVVKNKNVLVMAGQIDMGKIILFHGTPDKDTENFMPITNGTIICQVQRL